MARSKRSDDLPGRFETEEWKRCLTRFNEAWRCGSPPDIDAFLRPPRDLLIELVKVDLRYRWQRWMDVTGDTDGARYGVALLSDCKYGGDVLGSEMRLTLLRSPVYAFHQPRLAPGPITLCRRAIPYIPLPTATGRPSAPS